MNTYRGLGFDPAPGDPRRVGALADALTTAGRQVADGQDQVAGAVSTSAPWQGRAADGFRRQAGDQAARLTAHQGTAADAAAVLFDWASTLSDLQRRAEQLDRQARTLRGRLTEVEQAVEEWTTAVSVASTHARAAAEATLAEHEQTLAGLRAELNSVLAAAQRIAAEHRSAVDATTARLRALLPTGGATAPMSTTSATGMGPLLAGLSDATRRAAVAAGLPGSGAAPVGSPAAGALALVAAPPPVRATGSWVFGRSVPAQRLRATFPTEGGAGAST
ncbi:MAG TPA: hypothetical protein VHX38_26555 [Pseudonocardiaceae bacterium]|nr:hypothetical protein [Pseudonocardiaceae bacterium]